MTAADKIAEARALIEPLTGRTPGRWRVRPPGAAVGMHGYSVAAPTPEGPGWPTPAATGEYCMAYPPPHGGDKVSVQEANARLIAAAPDMRDTVAALADLAEAQAQRIAALEGALAELANALELPQQRGVLTLVPAALDRARATLGDTP